jgi:hypothetical protein
VDVRRLARDERADLAAFLATLSPQQWQAPTLCTQWRVRDVVAHVISYDDLDARGLLALAVRGRFRLGRINARCHGLSRIRDKPSLGYAVNRSGNWSYISAVRQGRCAAGRSRLGG